MGGQGLHRETAFSAGGVIGPAAFVTAWAVLGAGADGYDPVRDAISRLAAVGAPTRPVMTGALVVLGTGMVLYSQTLRTRLGGPAWAAALANGVFTLGIAALPLGSSYDTFHGIAAGLGYVSLAAVPLLAAPRVASARRDGTGGLLHARVAVATGILSGLSLALSLAGWRSGLFQRLGLTLAQAWVVASAVGPVRSHAGGR